MCLAIPMTIIRMEEHRAVAFANGVETLVDISLAPDLKLNDKVLVHAGFVIEKLDPEEAKEIEKVWDEYNAVMAAE